MKLPISNTRPLKCLSRKTDGRNLLIWKTIISKTNNYIENIFEIFFNNFFW